MFGKIENINGMMLHPLRQFLIPPSINPIPILSPYNGDMFSIRGIIRVMVLFVIKKGRG
jgi:hypothetical protein